VKSFRLENGLNFCVGQSIVLAGNVEEEMLYTWKHFLKASPTMGRLVQFSRGIKYSPFPIFLKAISAKIQSPELPLRN
jgi:hypothetical protein